MPSPSPSPSELRCQAALLRHAARRSDRDRVRDTLLARARRLEADAEQHEAERSASAAR
jgi:hypothetical protein